MRLEFGFSKMILENDGGRIATNPDRFDKLITATRTAVNNDGTLDNDIEENYDNDNTKSIATCMYSNMA